MKISNYFKENILKKYIFTLFLMLISNIFMKNNFLNKFSITNKNRIIMRFSQ